MKHRIVLTAALGTASLLLAGCGGPVASETASSEASDDLTEITVGTMPIVTNMPLALGVEKGFFEEEGLDVELATGQGGSALLPAVVSGQYDFAFSNNVSLMTARAQGLPIKVVAAASSAGKEPAPSSEAIVAGPDSDIDSLDDIDGSRVAVNALKNMVEVADRAALEKAGVDLDAVKFIEMGFPDMPAALASGRIEVAHVAEPFLTQTLNDGSRILTDPYRDMMPDIHLSSWFTTEDFIAQEGETVAAFKRAYEKSRAYASEHREEVRDFTSEFLGMKSALAKEISLGKWPAGLPSEASLDTWYKASVKYGVFSADELEDPTEILAD